jgi:hypothetical protein
MTVAVDVAAGGSVTSGSVPFPAQAHSKIAQTAKITAGRHFNHTLFELRAIKRQISFFQKSAHL